MPGYRALIGLVMALAAAVALKTEPGVQPASASSSRDVASVARSSSDSAAVARRGRRHGHWWRHPVGQGNPAGCSAQSTPSSQQPEITFFSMWSREEATRAGQLRVGQLGFFCFYGFRATKGSYVKVTVRAPRGLPVTSIVHPSFNELMMIRAAMPDDPRGRYTIIARQGKLEVQSTFYVLPAIEPTLFISDPVRPYVPVLAPGRSLTIVLAGLRPRSRATIDIYRYANPKLDLFAYLRSVAIQIRGNGTAVYPLRAASLPGTGPYVVVLPNGQQLAREGCFTETRKPFGTCVANWFLY